MKILKIMTCLILATIITSLTYAQFRDGKKSIFISIGKSDGFISKIGYGELLSRHLFLLGAAQYESKTNNEFTYRNTAANFEIGYQLPLFRYKAYLKPQAGLTLLYERGKSKELDNKWKFNYGPYAGVNFSFYLVPNILVGVDCNQKLYIQNYYGNLSYDISLRLAYTFF